MAIVLLAVMINFFAATRAEAQDDVSCTEPTLSGAKANSTLRVDDVGQNYPHLTATTDYEIPSTWPGVAALLGQPGDERYDAALRCFIAQWPSDQIAAVGEYRQQPPALMIVEAIPAANGKAPTVPARIVLHDEVTGDLTSSTAPPFLGPWEVAPAFDHLQFRLITNDHAQYRPLAFDSMIWKTTVKLSGLHFRRLEPTPVSTGSKEESKEASWAPIPGAKSGVLQISVTLDVPTRIAIASNSGTTAVASYFSLIFIDAVFYVTLLVLLLRHGDSLIGASASEQEIQQRVRVGIRTARWISLLGLFAGSFRALAYWLYRTDTGLPGVTMLTGYWRWGGLVSIWIVGLIMLVFSGLARRTVLAIFGLFLIVYGTVLLVCPQRFGLNQNFTPLNQSAGLELAIFRSAGGQLILMTLLTCAALFLTVTVFHFTLWFMEPCAASDDEKVEEIPDLRRLKGYGLPFWKFAVPSFLISLVLTSQWVWQAMNNWNANNIFPVVDNARGVALIQSTISAMFTYYFDLFGELTGNSVVWAAIAAIIFTLYWCGRSTRSPRPIKGEYLLLGLLFASLVVPTGDWYDGFTVPIPFVVAFAIVGFILPWTGQFNMLESICVQRFSRIERRGSIPSHTMHKEERELILMLPGSPDLRGRLVARQLQTNALRDRAHELDAELASGKVDVHKYRLEREKIDNSLADCQFPPASVAAESRPAAIHRWRRELSTILRRRVDADDSISPWMLPQRVRPADVALAIGPRTRWYDNGILAAKIGAVLSTPATAYFSYDQTRDGQWGAFNSYLGSLRLLSYVVWEVGFWLVAAFVLGCLWTTLPGRQGLIKGTVLWMGFSIPFAIGFGLGQKLPHQTPFSGTEPALHVPLLLLELLLVGLALDWFTLRDADTLRIHRLQPLVTLYGVRRLVPALTAAVPLLATLIGAYFQVKSGFGAPGVQQLPAPQPR